MINDAERLLRHLVAQPRETEWLEFKTSKFDADDVGKYVSALANSAMLHEQKYGYLVFGIEDRTHNIVGTEARLKAERVGSDMFELWLSRLLKPSVNFEIAVLEVDGVHVEIVRVDPAYQSPVRFKHDAYIRIDSALRPLRDYPERERSLWTITSRFTFEEGISAPNFSPSEVISTFDAQGLLTRLGAPRLTESAIIDRLLRERLLVDNMQGGLDATNLLALLAARDIGQFPTLLRKAPRVITYSGTSKSKGLDDETGQLGYAIGFPKLLRYIMEKIPHKEEMKHGTRVTVYAIPEIAVREFVANALIHQDLTTTGNGPIVEIFSDRIKITNPGAPFVDPSRLIDAPARSRNEKLSAMMRRLGLCEERGSGVDRAVEAIEASTLAPPLFQVVETSTVITLFSAQRFAQMSKDDRLRACYQHASVRFEASAPMSNQSLRNRFGLTDRQYPQVSLVIREALDAGLIKPMDPDQANRTAKYLPFWA